ncbi:hypothetical protein L484_003283 [Morus notabilis]|uniref:Uncharacterized protein n=1 Tax=Morus notabilis TaxID=981085 RepID=W9SI23_9ROSA|nr:hypothetical protein L484_003283 [Morus notabilis]
MTSEDITKECAISFLTCTTPLSATIPERWNLAISVQSHPISQSLLYLLPYTKTKSNMIKSKKEATYLAEKNTWSARDSSIADT